MEEEKEAPKRLSRREFVKGAAVGAAGAAAAGALASCAPAAAPAPTPTEAAAVATATPIIKEVEAPIAAPAKGHIVYNPDICAGCRTCEVVCSLYKEGVVNPQLARIQTSTDKLGGFISEVYLCKQCEGPECLLACATGALYVDEVTGARVIDEEKCIGCELCVEACPCTPPRVRYNAEKNVAFKCDLCGGDPQCVKFCPGGALAYVEEEA